MPETVSSDELAARKRLEQVASWMDDRWRIPFTPIRFGLDALLGLVPFAGDLVGGLLSLWVVSEGVRLGTPRRLILRMLGNVLLEVGVGAVPVLGDVFDLYWKASRRNLRLLVAHLDARSGAETEFAQRGSLLLLLVVGLCIVALIWLLAKVVFGGSAVA